MAETTPSGVSPAPPGVPSIAEEDAAFYHQSAVNATWTGARLALGSLTFIFGAFAFAYFYLRSLNSSGRWQGSGFVHPSIVLGTVIMLLTLASACVHYAALQQIKAGRKRAWQLGGIAALLLGLAAVAMQITELATLSFAPGSSGYASVFTGFYPVFLTVQFGVLVWLETLLARSRFIPEMSFVEQPPTHGEVYTVQRFQASLSAFSTVWGYLAVMSLLFWLLFYAF
jgi:heme/copper-type cytochrome/quinol oxidase subunit 3